MLQHTANISANLGVLIKNYFIYLQKDLTSKKLKITQIYLFELTKDQLMFCLRLLLCPFNIFKNYSFNLSFQSPRQGPGNV